MYEMVRRPAEGWLAQRWTGLLSAALAAPARSHTQRGSDLPGEGHREPHIRDHTWVSATTSWARCFCVLSRTQSLHLQQQFWQVQRGTRRATLKGSEAGRGLSETPGWCTAGEAASGRGEAAGIQQRSDAQSSIEPLGAAHRWATAAVDRSPGVSVWSSLGPQSPWQHLQLCSCPCLHRSAWAGSQTSQRPMLWARPWRGQVEGVGSHVCWDQWGVAGLCWDGQFQVQS